MTDGEQLARLIENSTPGRFKSYRGVGTGIELNVKQHLDNLREIRARIQRAREAGCFLEAIELRLQLFDLWLRIYFVNKVPDGTERQREFGRLLEQCRELGLVGRLADRLKEFNRRRVEAVHGFLIGRMKYENLLDVLNESEHLASELMLTVIDNCGEEIGDFRGQHFDRGDMVIDVQKARLAIRTE